VFSEFKRRQKLVLKEKEQAEKKVGSPDSQPIKNYFKLLI
jgi:hypothetical protein